MALAGKKHFTSDDARTYVSQMLGCATDVPDHLLAAAMRTDGRARAMMMANGIAGIGCDARLLVSQAHQPLAILHGTAEPFVRLDYLEKLSYANLWRGAVQLFKGDGHAPHWTNPLAFNGLMLEFLDDVQTT